VSHGVHRRARAAVYLRGFSGRGVKMIRARDAISNGARGEKNSRKRLEGFCRAKGMTSGPEADC
jgi:hypothetical protein